MKTHQTLPTEKQFFDAYAGFISGLKVTGYLAQVLSFATQVPPLYLMILATFAGIITGTTAAAIAGILAVTFSASIEIAARLAIPYAARQVLYKRFRGLHLVMSIGIYLVALTVAPMSVFISFHASKAIVKEISQPPTYAEPIDTTTAAATDSLNRQLAATLDSLDKEADKTLATLRRARYNSEAKQAGQFLAQEAETRTEASRRKDAAAATTAAAIAALTSGNAQAIAEAKAALKAALDEHNKRVSQGGAALAWLTLILSLVSYTSMILEEVKKKGAGIEQVAEIGTYEHRPGILVEGWQALSDRVNAKARGMIARFADATPPPPEPSQYHLPSSTADRLKAIEAQLSAQDADPDPEPPLPHRQQIGYHQGTPPPAPEVPKVTNRAGLQMSVNAYATGTPDRFTIQINRPAYQTGLFLAGHTIQPARSIDREQWQQLPGQIDATGYNVTGFKPCQECGTMFSPKNHWHYYCGEVCRRKADNRKRSNRKR